jgi:hypothetical protein
VAEADPPLAFACHKALAPLLWVFAVIMAAELLITHLLVSALWSKVAALILSALSLAALVWTIFFIRSLKRRPVLVDAEGVTMRIGSLKSVRVPAGHIGGLRTSWLREELKQRGVLNFGLINYPNVMLDLDPPLPNGKRRLKAIAHRLDDPVTFAAAVARLTEARV